MPRSLLTTGLSLTLRNLRALLWTYAFNLGIALLFSLSLHNQLSTLLAHSLASQSLLSGFDLTTVASLFTFLSDSPGGPATSFTAVPVYLLVYFLLVPGTLFVYQTAAPARLSTLFQSGILHFWRFVRITIISFLVFGIFLGPMLAVQNAWTKYLDKNILGRNSFLLQLAGLVLVGLVAALLRLYFDLVEVYTVQLGLQLKPNGQPDRRVRRAFAPAWRALTQNLLRAYLTFILLTLVGLSAVIVTARIAMHSLAQPRVWPMFLLAQCGLFLMLLTRFWQRGAETTIALDFPIPPPIVAVPPPPFAADPIPNPEPASPSLSHPDFGVYHPDALPPPPGTIQPDPIENDPIEPDPIGNDPIGNDPR